MTCVLNCFDCSRKSAIVEEAEKKEERQCLCLSPNFLTLPLVIATGTLLN